MPSAFVPNTRFQERSYTVSRGCLPEVITAITMPRRSGLKYSWAINKTGDAWKQNPKPTRIPCERTSCHNYFRLLSRSAQSKKVYGVCCPFALNAAAKYPEKLNIAPIATSNETLLKQPTVIGRKRRAHATKNREVHTYRRKRFQLRILLLY